MCSVPSGIRVTTLSSPVACYLFIFTGTVQQDVGHTRDLRAKTKTRRQPQFVCLRQLRGIERVIRPAKAVNLLVAVADQMTRQG